MTVSDLEIHAAQESKTILTPEHLTSHFQLGPSKCCIHLGSVRELLYQVKYVYKVTVLVCNSMWNWTEPS